MELNEELLDFCTEKTVKKTKRSRDSKKEKVEATLIANMERVVKFAKDSNFDDAYFKEVDKNLKFITSKMEITEREAALLSLFMEMSSNGDTISLNDISRYINCSNLRVLTLRHEIDQLLEKRFLKLGGHEPYLDSTPSYSVPSGLVDAVTNNLAYKPESIVGLNSDSFFEFVADAFEQNNAINSVLRQIHLLIDKNPDLPFCRLVKGNLKKKLSETDLFMFYLFCNETVNEGNFSISESSWRPFFTRRSEFVNVKMQMMQNCNTLQKMKLVENNPESGMFGQSYRMTKKAIHTYLSEFDIFESETAKPRNLISCKSFAEKKLFYNAKEAKAITQITDLLQEDRFKAVLQRLEECGMRKGFACLFYGAPGTGKTETVNQLARATGRDVMVVDVSQIKDKYVGESEKNIKEAFDRYRTLVKNSEKAPILLFNEADAILGVRMEGAQHSVDKMNNSIQNIILQEMENLEGIMIATTNLTNNLDKAFERRFIYKIEFEKPTLEAKKKIWQGMISGLNEGLAQKLAEEFDLSGGQIENIARKRAVNYVLTGEEPTAEEYMELCQEELINERKPKQKMGFK